jgi:hypothetical protein
MKTLFLLGIVAILAIPSAADAQGERARGLTVHEWGTFLTMSGSDGVTLDGMYHEEHALPGFVHSRAKDQLRLHSALTKGETPVIYFYTDRPQRVNVRVDFPGGIWTHWYPQANLVGPGLAASGPPASARNGHIEWLADIIPASEARPGLPATSADALWNHARQVDAAFVRTRSDVSGSSAVENERFLFYRGLGTVEMPLDASFRSNGTLGLSASMPERLSRLFILRVENGRGAYKVIDALKPGGSVSDVTPSMEHAKPLAEFTKAVSDDLAGRLVESGLYEKEARAMVNTWKTSYFGTDGIRVLYVLPQSWTDQFIPIKVSPSPDRIVRVMVGRTELLTPERERRAESAVRDLGSKEAAVRERAFAFLQDQGRYAEPILRRIERTTADPAVRSGCARLLQSYFVTELRSASQSATDELRVVEKPVFVRAQLASLLREVGLNSEAADEGRKVLAELDRMSKPNDDSSGARHHLRAYARAAEAMGDDRAAVDWYSRFIKFGSQSKSCGGCHHEEGPRSMAFYRDWWAGKRYAAAVKRLGITDQTIKLQGDRLAANSSDTAARMMLAYLLQDNGDTAQSDILWASVEGRPARAASRDNRTMTTAANRRPSDRPKAESPGLTGPPR